MKKSTDYRRSNSKSVYPFKIMLFMCFRLSFFFSFWFLDHVFRPLPCVHACVCVCTVLSISLFFFFFFRLDSFLCFWAFFFLYQYWNESSSNHSWYCRKSIKGSSIPENVILKCILHEFLMLLTHFICCCGFIHKKSLYIYFIWFWGLFAWEQNVSSEETDWRKKKKTNQKSISNQLNISLNRLIEYYYCTYLTEKP